MLVQRNVPNKLFDKYIYEHWVNTLVATCTHGRIQLLIGWSTPNEKCGANRDASLRSRGLLYFYQFSCKIKWYNRKAFKPWKFRSLLAIFGQLVKGPVFPKEEFTKFTGAINIVDTEGVSKHRLSPCNALLSNINITILIRYRLLVLVLLKFGI